jgi:hypothetical protein
MHIDIAAVATVIGTLYPNPFDQPCRRRGRRKLGDRGALTRFEVNLVRLFPCVWSSQRHWHTAEDGSVYILGGGGDVGLVTEGGGELLHCGDAATGICRLKRAASDVSTPRLKGLDAGPQIGVGEGAFRMSVGRESTANSAFRHWIGASGGLDGKEE